MATLEKIRSKSVILFTVIIVALLAFILGDFLTSGRSFFGPGDTVASADGVDVKFDEYQKKTQELSAQFLLFFSRGCTVSSFIQVSCFIR